MTPPTVAIIGAGLSGARCAQQISRAGWQVTVFEKSRGVGGRMATRRLRIPGPGGRELPVEFDHGAPGFDSAPSSPAFAAGLHQAQAEGVVAPWADPSKLGGAAAPLTWVATPDMPALCRWLLRHQTVHTLCRVDALTQTPNGWALSSDGQTVGSGFAAVVIAIPPAQAAELLQPHRPEWARQCHTQVMSPCWTLMAVTDDPQTWPRADGLQSRATEAARSTLGHTGLWEPPSASPLELIIRQDTKPGRTALDGMACWVAHARPDWTRHHLEAAPEAVLPVMQAALQAVIGPCGRWHHAAVHRWRYARLEGPAQAENCRWDPGLGLGLCGDAWGQGGVVAAWASASSLCEAMLNRPLESDSQGPLTNPTFRTGAHHD